MEEAGEDGIVPEALEPPEILDGFAGWYADFWRLSSERQVGFGVGPIPASKIDDHTRGWMMEDAEMFEHCIHEMDGVYLAHANRSDSDKPTVAPGPPPRFADLVRGR